LTAPNNAAKAWLITYQERVAVRILCVARTVLHNISKRYRIESRRHRFAAFPENSVCRVEILEIQAIARFESVCPHEPTRTNSNSDANRSFKCRRSHDDNHTHKKIALPSNDTSNPCARTEMTQNNCSKRKKRYTRVQICATGRHMNLAFGNKNVRKQ
jgi:hypothetical protein